MRPQVIIVMGVSGAGKSTVGRALAAELSWAFYDADDFHPASNVSKMAAGVALNDADRQPWLDALHGLITTTLETSQTAVLACSALKKSYRRVLRGELGKAVRVVYLAGSFELIKERLEARSGHFMKAELLRSQFAALEKPEDALTVSIDQHVTAIVEMVITELRLERRDLTHEQRNV